MQRRLFFHSPIDHENHRSDWKDLAKTLERAARNACKRDVEILVEAGPRFTPRPAEPLFEGAPAWAADVGTEETLAALSEETLDPRTVQIEPWSTYPGYAVLCATLGHSIRRDERRDLQRRIPKVTKRQCRLLYEHVGDDQATSYDTDTARAVGFHLDPDDDVDRARVEDLLMPFDSPAYVCERWMIESEGGGSLDESYLVLREIGPSLVVCMVQSKGAESQQDAHVRLWSNAARGSGLYALFPDDDQKIDTLARHLDAASPETSSPEQSELEITLDKAYDGLPMISIGRGHPRLVVAYATGYEWFSGKPPVFIV